MRVNTSGGRGTPDVIELSDPRRRGLEVLNDRILRVEGDVMRELSSNGGNSVLHWLHPERWAHTLAPRPGADEGVCESSSARALSAPF